MGHPIHVIDVEKAALRAAKETREVFDRITLRRGVDYAEHLFHVILQELAQH